MRLRFLANSEAILASFEEAAKDAGAIAVAVAWATPSKPVDILCRAASRGVDIRVLVGRDFGGTDPDAVEQLLGACRQKVKWAAPGKGIFHAKLYIFQGAGRCRVLIGSANMTAAAFGANTETMCEIEAPVEELERVLSIFADLWERGTTVTDDDLDEYRVENAARSKAHRRHAIARAESAVSGVLSWDLPEYAARLKEQAELWRPYGVHVDGDTSWLNALRTVSPLACRSLQQLTLPEKKALLGLESDDFPSAAHFGRNKGNGLAVQRLTGAFGATQEEVDKALSLLPAPPEKPTLAQVEKAYHRLRNIEKMGSAIATRLLMLKRPDYLVSLNNASREAFAELFGIPKSRLQEWTGYGAAIKALWRAPWMVASAPMNVRDRELWSFRAALLDVFAYRPSEHGHPIYSPDRKQR